LVVGELSEKKKAMLPVFAALGGMIVPAIIYFLINVNHPELIKGAGIPTATDIAFAIAIMGMLGDKVPASLKVFLTALAIIDDLGAIFVIAIFYGSHFSVLYLSLSAITIAILYWLNKKNINNIWIYIILGITLWFFMLHSGVHATLSGVILAFLIPFQPGKQHTISQRLEHALQSPVTYIILPVFALANTAIRFEQPILETLNSSLGLGILLGLFLGKPIGIVSFSYLAQKLNIAQIAQNIRFIQLLGAGILGGIGFTMAIFVTNLAFESDLYIANGKIAILFGSFTAAGTGYVLLNYTRKHT
jgi:NhaA family Na+:H+ antiporter